MQLCLEKADILKHHLLIGSYAFWVFKSIYDFDYFLITMTNIFFLISMLKNICKNWTLKF